jgi:RNA polymerase sigma factor (sigma-70 family)
MKQDEDVKLWLTYRQGDREALGLLAERYYRTLLRYGLKFGEDAQVVEDCIQNIFLDLWQNRLRISSTQSVKFYLLKSLRHAIIHQRSYQKRFRYVEESGWESSIPDPVNAENYLIEQESLTALLAQLQLQLSALPRREREAIYLRYYENLNVEQIAEIMGINKQSVSNFLQKALSKLRSRWMPTLAMSLIFY